LESNVAAVEEALVGVQQRVDDSMTAFGTSVDDLSGRVKAEVEEIRGRATTLERSLGALTAGVERSRVRSTNVENKTGQLERQLVGVERGFNTRVTQLEANLDGRMTDWDGKVDNVEGRMNALMSNTAMIQSKTVALDGLVSGVQVSLQDVRAELEGGLSLSRMEALERRLGEMEKRWTAAGRDVTQVTRDLSALQDKVDRQSSSSSVPWMLRRRG